MTLNALCSMRTLFDPCMLLRIRLEVAVFWYMILAVLDMREIRCFHGDCWDRSPGRTEQFPVATEAYQH